MKIRPRIKVTIKKVNQENNSFKIKKIIIFSATNKNCKSKFMKNKEKLFNKLIKLQKQKIKDLISNKNNKIIKNLKISQNPQFKNMDMKFKKTIIFSAINKKLLINKEQAFNNCKNQFNKIINNSIRINKMLYNNKIKMSNKNLKKIKKENKLIIFLVTNKKSQNSRKYLNNKK